MRSIHQVIQRSCVFIGNLRSTWPQNDRALLLSVWQTITETNASAVFHFSFCTFFYNVLPVSLAHTPTSCLPFILAALWLVLLALPAFLALVWAKLSVYSTITRSRVSPGSWGHKDAHTTLGILLSIWNIFNFSNMHRVKEKAEKSPFYFSRLSFVMSVIPQLLKMHHHVCEGLSSWLLKNVFFFMLPSYTHTCHCCEIHSSWNRLPGLQQIKFYGAASSSF